MDESQLAYYREAGPMSDLGPHTARASFLPAEVTAIRDVVQGLVLHVFWAERYGVELTEERKAEVNLRRVDRQLSRLLEIDGSPLGRVRPPERRLVGNCRDFSVLMTALLRAKGIPARARCGFGTYFVPGRYEDHWVCEYWNAAARRWILVDAQLDELQRKVLQLDFDPLDVPRDRFIVGGMAWEHCREGRADPERFGIFDMHGLWFVRGDLLRDFLSLNKVEILPWDHGWGHLGVREEEMSDGEYALMDRIARATQAGDGAFAEIRELYDSDPGFAPPPSITE